MSKPSFSSRPLSVGKKVAAAIAAQCVYDVT